MSTPQQQPSNVVEFASAFRSSDRALPESVDLEEAVVATILGVGGKVALMAVQEFLKPEHFYAPAYRHLYRVIVDLDESGQPIDMMTVAEKLRTLKLLDDVGGRAALVRLMESYPSHEIVHHAKKIVEQSVRRDIIRAGQEQVMAAYNQDISLDEVVDASEQRLFNATQHGLKETFRSPEVSMDSLYRETVALNEGRGLYLPTGFPVIDSKLTGGGVKPGQLVVVGAPSSCGKSSLADNLATNHAQQGCSVAIYTFEMDDIEYRRRTISRLSGLPISAMVTKGGMDEEGCRKFATAIAEGAALPIWIAEDPFVKFSNLRSQIRRLKAKTERSGTPLKVVIIDHLHDMPEVVEAGKNRVSEIARICKGLKRLANELGVVIYLLGQFNREGSEKAQKGIRPVKEDMDGGGSIEQAASVVLLMYRDELHDPESPDQGMVEIIGGKQRDGQRFNVKLGFIPERFKFYDPSVPVGGQSAQKASPKLSLVVNAPESEPKPDLSKLFAATLDFGTQENV